MKKLAVLLALFCSVFLVGCGGTAQLSFDQKRPWKIFNDRCKETMTYDVKIYSGTENDILLTTDDSKYEVSLNEKLAVVGGESTVVVEVQSTLTVVYRDDLDFADRGKRDVIETSAIFRLDNLSTLSSYRKATLEDREGKNNDSFELIMDYQNKTSSITYHNGEQKTMKLNPSKVVYDNEMLYYLVRSFSTIKKGSSDSFKISNGYENFLRGKYSTYSLKQTTEDTVDVEVGSNIYDFVSSSQDSYTKELDGKTHYFITCHRTQIGLKSSKSGPSFYSYMSKCPFSLGAGGTLNTYKVPIALVNYEYDLEGKTSRTQICTLIDYSAQGNYT